MLSWDRRRHSACTVYTYILQHRPPHPQTVECEKCILIRSLQCFFSTRVRDECVLSAAQCDWWLHSGAVKHLFGLLLHFCRILGFRKKPWFLQHVLYSWQDTQSFLQWPQSHAHVRPISFSLQVAMVCCMTANWPWSLKEGEKWCRRWMSVHVSWHMQLKDVRLIGKKQAIYQGQCTCSTSCDVLHLHQTFPKSGQWFLTLASLMNCYHY